MGDYKDLPMTLNQKGIDLKSEKRGGYKYYTHTLNLFETQSILKTTPRGHDNASQRKASSDFCKESYPESLKLATEGDLEAYTSLTKLAQKIMEKKGAFAPRNDLISFNNVSGGSVNIDAFLRGEPDCMIDYGFGSVIKKSVNIRINVSVPWFEKPETLKKRGSMIYTLIRALELSGHAVGVEVCAPVERNSQYARLNTNVIIKRAGEYLSPAQVAYWTTSPSALRRSFFRLQEEYTDEIRDTLGFNMSNGYGSSRELQKEELPEDILYFQGCFKLDNVAKTAEEDLRKMGIDLGDIHKTLNQLL